MAALAAKHLGRLKGIKSYTEGGMLSSPATMEMYPNAAQVDWFLKGANYYHMATSEISGPTSEGFSVSSTTAFMSSIEAINKWMSSNVTPNSLNPASENLHDISVLRRAEELLAVAVLLTSYELIDVDGAEWPR